MERGAFPVVLVAWSRVQARLLGPKACAEAGVGPLILELKSQLSEVPENLIGPYATGTRDTVAMLEANCRICPHAGRCKMVPKSRRVA